MKSVTRAREAKTPASAMPENFSRDRSMEVSDTLASRQRSLAIRTA